MTACGESLPQGEFCFSRGLFAEGISSTATGDCLKVAPGRHGDVHHAHAVAFGSRTVRGEAVRRRVFREDEIVLLAPALSHALAQAKPDELVFFHLGRPGSGGGEKGTTPLQTGMPGVALGRPITGGGQESTAGWIFVRGPSLHLLLREVQHAHRPVSDIS